MYKQQPPLPFQFIYRKLYEIFSLKKTTNFINLTAYQFKENFSPSTVKQGSLQKVPLANPLSSSIIFTFFTVGSCHSLSTKHVVCPHFFTSQKRGETYHLPYHGCTFWKAQSFWDKGRYYFCPKKYLMLFFITNIRQPNFLKN